MSRKPFPIRVLQPRWLETKGQRYGIGFDMLCPTHLGHRLTFYFVNPADGGFPVSADVHYWRVGGALVELTVLNQAPDDELPLVVPGHWKGRIVEGLVHTEVDGTS